MRKIIEDTVDEYAKHVTTMARGIGFVLAIWFVVWLTIVGVAGLVKVLM
jgi:hypothetical protein